MTKKVAGSRMGKGKGKLAGWVAQLSPGVNMFELKNLRPGRANYFFKQVAYRLPVKSKLLYANKKKVPLIWNNSKKITHETFFS
jgi:large subunit ribosomal protein L16